MSQLRIKDIMTRYPVMIQPGKTVIEAARLMRDIDCGVLPVGTTREHIAGVITDRDIVTRIVAAGQDPCKTTIQEAMSKKLYTCDEDDRLEFAARIMRKHNVARVVVTKGTSITGIVTMAELLRSKGDVRSSDQVLHELLGASNSNLEELGALDQAEEDGKTAAFVWD